MSSWWNDSQDVTIDVSDVIGQIPTEDLERELKERKDLQKTDVKEFEREERRRGSELDVSICLDDYNLIREEDVDITDFELYQVIDYIESNGYAVFEKGVTTENKLGCLAHYLGDVPGWKLKELLCDMLGVGHLTSRDDIIREIKEKIN